ncbi:MAG: MaoC family dehydratase N-terminal domain-containing protein [Candidatus Dormibacteraeota bacterium]|uniref:MaoC family dehydratase N-terminal domain-containing protein n=1 Tax=Candidatus Amunia macphersoniae TaxID=3127014 RepID=A0A934KMS6_9BACT|nr:MaoC family dehydratase N-terminal domain-containing protein [Candidatus Dormibacteraeota bacterium]
MPDQSHVGRRYEANGQVVDGAGARAFAQAIAGSDEVYAASVVPPTYAAVYCLFPTLYQLFGDAEVGVSLAGLVHGEQSFTWPNPVRSGDVVDATAVIASVEDKRGMTFLGIDHEAHRQDGETVCRGHSLMIIR